MTIQLKPEMEAKLNRLVASGRFQSIEEALEVGLDMLEQNEAWLKYADDRIDQGLADIAAGRTVSGDTLLDHLRGAQLKQA